MLVKIIRWLWGGIFLISLTTEASPVVRFTLAESDGPPMVILDNNHLAGGLLKELGDAIAHELNAKAEYSVVSRGRVELLIEQKNLFIACNTNPKWYIHSSETEWTEELYPQIERLVSKNTVSDIRSADDLKGKKIATIYGYSYPEIISHLWYTNQAVRIQSLRLEAIMNRLLRNVSDVAIVSELEFSYWAEKNPISAASLKLHPYIVSKIPTMCAVSEGSDFSADDLNKAIDRLKANGKLNSILKRYRWRAR